MQVRLCNALHEFVVSTSNVQRTMVRSFLFEKVRVFQFLKVRFSLEYLSLVDNNRLPFSILGLSRERCPQKIKKTSVKPSVKSVFLFS